LPNSPLRFSDHAIPFRGKQARELIGKDCVSDSSSSRGASKSESFFIRVLSVGGHLPGLLIPVNRGSHALAFAA
jgi:hypothetical protein